MLELLLSPRKAERHPWEMFFVGFFYACLAVIVVTWIFGSDAALVKYSGILIVTFTVMFSMPFVYYSIKNEEEKDMKYSGFFKSLKIHSRPLLSLMWLFIGFVVAFSVMYIVMHSDNNFKAQIEVFCQINQPGNVNSCVEQYQMQGVIKTTGYMTAKDKIFVIFGNNVMVLIFTLVFSLLFGAGAIFILAWNASVIAAAIGIFTKSDLAQLPLGLARYMIHGVPEIGAYFIGALAGGIVSIAVIRHDTNSDKFWGVLQDSLNMIILAIVVLFIAALIEVFITPVLF